MAGVRRRACQQTDLPWLPYLALEYHCPRMIHAALSGTVLWYHWGNLAGAAVLALLWAGAAAFLFPRWGWHDCRGRGLSRAAGPVQTLLPAFINRWQDHKSD